MNILLISSSYLPVLGGLQNVTHRLARFLIERGHAVHVITNRYPRNLPETETLDGISIWRYPMSPVLWSDLRRGKLGQFLYSVFYAKQVHRQLDAHMRDFKPDLINFHFPTYTSVFVSRLKERWRVPLVVSLHGNDVLGLNQRSPEDQLSYHRLLQSADLVTACSRSLLEEVERQLPNILSRDTVTYNGVDVELFQISEPYQHSRLYFFACGRCTPVKGFDLLVEAFIQIALKFPQIDLILAGDGEQLPELKQRAESCQLHTRIHFLGRTASNKIASLIRGAEFVVVPSRYESFGIVALEAMSAGKFVLASDVGGLKEIVSVPPNERIAPTVETLVEALTRILARYTDPTFNDSAIRIANQAFVKQFTWETSLGKYEELFEKLNK